jgi:serine/threonine protein phosphatase PrpC
MLMMVGSTDVGQRSHNEDCFVVDEELALAVVADGMGGYASGEVASSIVAETLVRELTEGNSLSQAISQSHHAVKSAVVAGRGGAGMGAAVVGVVFRDYDYQICWVGDCRAYLWDGEALRQLTRDHSYVESLLSRGLITWQESETRPDRNLITQAVGATAVNEVDVDSVEGSLTRGEELLLCSDGLNDVLSGQTIGEILDTDTPPNERCEQLVRAAARAGGKDNITALLVTPDGAAPAGPGVKPAAVSISRLNGEVEYFTLREDAGTIPAETTAPASAEREKTGIRIPSPHSGIDYDALESDRPRGSYIKLRFVKNVLLGLGVGGAMAALALFAKWFIGN